MEKKTTNSSYDLNSPGRLPGGRVLPYMGYIGMCGPKGYGFSAVLVINQGIDYSHFAAIVVINKVSIFAL